ncbi:LysR family transcriptional regulator [Thaumasiovibrio sp. DFM-14]|uniref:LysR family transcriptional regulator n=1 Tax=Thaumasiovibrio sp. DFM-14 TaxID=3384792 RepID=UPI00399F599D
MKDNPQFSLEQLIAFDALAVHGSYSKAAKSLKKDRSTIHQHIQNLEIDLDVSLFSRGPHGSELTENGTQILALAKHILFSAQHLQFFSTSLNKDEVGQFNVYYDSSIPIVILMKAHRMMKNKYPHVQINWFHRELEEVHRSVVTDEASFGITLMAGKGTIPSKGLDFINLGFFKMAIYAGKETKLGKMKSCTLADLKHETEYILESYLAIQMFKVIGLSTDRCVISNQDMLLSHVENDGWAMLPEYVIASSPIGDRFEEVKPNFFNNDIQWSYIMLGSNMSVGLRGELANCIKAAFLAPEPSFLHGKLTSDIAS